MTNYYVAMRTEAIKRYYQGEAPIAVYRSLRRSKKWFFKWLNRNKASGSAHWYLDQKRARKHQNYALTMNVERAIVNKRLELEKDAYQQIGACKIRSELKKLAIEPLPHVWQINRVLSRHKLTRAKGPYKPKGKAYPAMVVTMPGVVHQTDFTPARKLYGEGIVRALNSIDIYSRKSCVAILRTRQAKATMSALVSTWKRLGIPRYIQFDNDPVFQHGSLYSRSMARVLRLVLSLGIEPIFIPPREPWRNSHVEHFNSIYKYTFFNSQRWNTLQHIRSEARNFEDIYNDTHCCSSRNGYTPNEVTAQFKTSYLPDDYRVPVILPYPQAGKVHFMRFVRSNRKIRILADEFKLKDSIVYEYVKATVDIKEQALFIYFNDELIQSFNYKTQPTTNIYFSDLTKSESHLCGAT